MQLGPDRIGSRGLAVLAVAGLVGVGLAVHGYGHGVVVSGQSGIAGLAATGGSHARSSTPGASPTSSTQSTTQSPSAASQKLGPLLSSTSYAPYAFRVYPGPESTQARQATAGFRVQVTPRGGMIELSFSAAGSTQGAQTATFPPSDRVYFVEATFGDDSGDVDYNSGDDGLVVTDASGHVVQ